MEGLDEFGEDFLTPCIRKIINITSIIPRYVFKEKSLIEKKIADLLKYFTWFVWKIIFFNCSVNIN